MRDMDGEGDRAFVEWAERKWSHAYADGAVIFPGVVHVSDACLAQAAPRTRPTPTSGKASASRSPRATTTSSGRSTMPGRSGTNSRRR